MRRDESGEHRLQGREFEGLRHAHDENEGEDARLVEVSGEAQYREQGDRQPLDGPAHRDDATAVELVGHVPGGKGQKHGGYELHEADQAQVEGAVGQFVDLPADGDGHHLEAEARGAPGEPEIQEGAMAQ